MRGEAKEREQRGLPAGDGEQTTARRGGEPGVNRRSGGGGDAGDRGCPACRPRAGGAAVRAVGAEVAGRCVG